MATESTPGLLGSARRTVGSWASRHATTLVVVAFIVGVGFLPFVKMELVANGIIIGGIIALGAIGATLIFGILGFANLAHGDYMTSGAYLGLFLMGSVLPRIGLEGEGLGPFTFGYPVLIALPLTVVAVAVGAIWIDASIYRRLRNRRAGLIIMTMTSLGMAIALRGLVRMIWGGDTAQYPRESRQFYNLPLEISMPPDAVFISAVSVILVAAVYIILNYTRMGKAMRATSDNPDLALVSGIDTAGVIRWTWAIGAGLAATAGVLLAVFQAQLLPVMGWDFMLLVFASLTLGGIGNPHGALMGALLIGVTSEIATEWMNPSYKPVVAFAIMILALLVRPRGIIVGKLR